MFSDCTRLSQTNDSIKAYLSHKFIVISTHFKTDITMNISPQQSIRKKKHGASHDRSMRMWETELLCQVSIMFTCIYPLREFREIQYLSLLLRKLKSYFLETPYTLKEIIINILERMQIF